MTASAPPPSPDPSPSAPSDWRHLYVHVPFCRRRCIYCDFSIAVRGERDGRPGPEGRRTRAGRGRRGQPVAAGDYLRALALELDSAFRPVGATPCGCPSDAVGAPPCGCPSDGPETLYLGGGTPSLLGAEGVAAVCRLLPLSRRLREFTLEANPDDVSRAAASAWRKAGVSRLSLGAQSFDPGALAWMHRTHRAEATGAAVRAARKAGIARVSLDLIFALPDGVRRDWRADLEAGIALDPDHISLYGLAVESGTPLGRRVGRGEIAAASEQRYQDDYLLAHELLPRAGYHFYELSNAAREGAESLHNQAYWCGGPYLGLGPSAHSFDGAARWWNLRPYVAWQRALAAGESPVEGREELGAEQLELERLYLGLRAAAGAVVRVEVGRRWVEAGWAVWGSAPEPPGAAPGNHGGLPLRTTLGPGQPQGVAPTHHALRPTHHAPAASFARVALTPEGWLRLDALVLNA